MPKFSEYKVVHIDEQACPSVLHGAKVTQREFLEAQLDSLTEDGWQVIYQVVEKKRHWLFWHRESVITTLAR